MNSRRCGAIASRESEKSGADWQADAPGGLRPPLAGSIAIEARVLNCSKWERSAINRVCCDPAPSRGLTTNGNGGASTLPCPGGVAWKSHDSVGIVRTPAARRCSASRNLSAQSDRARLRGPNNLPPAASTAWQRVNSTPPDSGAITSVASLSAARRSKSESSSAGDFKRCVRALRNGAGPSRESQVVTTSTFGIRDRSSTIAVSMARPSSASDPEISASGQPPPQTYSEMKTFKGSKSSNA